MYLVNVSILFKILDMAYAHELFCMELMDSAGMKRLKRIPGLVLLQPFKTLKERFGRLDCNINLTS